MTGLTKAPSRGLALGTVQVDQRPYFATIARYRTKASRETARFALKAWAKKLGVDDPSIVPWYIPKYEHWAILWSHMAETSPPSSANLRRSVFFGLMEECWKFELITLDELTKIRTLKKARGSALPRGRHVELGEIRLLLEEAGVRDRALLALLYGAGLRRAELAGADMADLTLPEKGTSGAEIRVMGKGHKERLVPLPPGTVSALRAWLELRGSDPGPLFVAIATSGGRPCEGLDRLSLGGVGAVVRRLYQRLSLAKITPHDFRRTYAGVMLGITDISTLQRLMGHSQVTTTQRYDRRDEREGEQAAGKFFVPETKETKR